MIAIQSEGRHLHAVPADDPVRAVKILREAAGLEPLPDDNDDPLG
jgi:hypothetical protein